MVGIILIGMVAFFSFLYGNTSFANTAQLTIEKSIQTLNYPTSTGIPFKKGELFSLDNLRIDDAGKTEVAAQFTSLAKWPDGSHKSVLASFQAPLSSESTSNYIINYGTGVTRANYNSNLSVIENSSEIEVNTGKIKFTLNKNKFFLFNQVWTDNNQDSLFTNDESLLSSGGKIFLKNAYTAEKFDSSLDQSPVYSIEESGPQRVVIRAEGSLQSASGQTLTDYRIWIRAYNNSDQVDVDYTLVDNREESDVTSIAQSPESGQALALSATEYGIELPLKITETNYAFGGEDDIIYSGKVDATAEHYLLQRGQMNFITEYNTDGDPISAQFADEAAFSFSYEGVGSAEKAPGWVDVSNTQSGVSVLVKEFWQQFPNELSVSNGLLKISLHPEKISNSNPDTSYPSLDATNGIYTRPNTFYSTREGMSKTYRLKFIFHSANHTTVNTADINKVFQSNIPIITADASLYVNSKVFGNLSVADPGSAEYDQSLIDNLYDPAITQKDGKGSWAQQFGWRDYGDRVHPGWTFARDDVYRPSFYNDTHVGSNLFLTQYLRTKDSRWWKLGAIGTRHWMDIDVSHSNRKGYWSSGYGPGELHAAGHGSTDHSARNGHLSHAHISGLPTYYLLTGDPRALEVIKEIGDWWVNAVDDFFPVPRPSDFKKSAERDAAWPLYVINEVYRSTGDKKYLDVAAQMTTHLLEWWQQPADHITLRVPNESGISNQSGEVVSRNNANDGTGWWETQPMDNAGKCTNCNGTNPWMAGALLNAVIQYYELAKDYSNEQDYPKRTVIEDMMLQTMNYVIKNGWDNERKSFVYSEELRFGSNIHNIGATHILYPLVYLSKLLDNSGHTNPEWFDTKNIWPAIADQFYKDWNNQLSGFNNGGWFGYELMFQADFFNLMNDVNVGSNQAPTAITDYLTTAPDTTVTSNVLSNVLSNDIDFDFDSLSLISVENGAHGISSIDDKTGILSYSPDSDYTGTDEFSYIVSDTTGNQTTGYVKIIIANATANQPPNAIADSITTTQNTLITLNVLLNDTDPDNDSLVLQSTSDAKNGTVTLENTIGIVSYLPDPGFLGTDRFNYVVSDNNGGSDQSTVTVTVNSGISNQAPVVTVDTMTTNKAVLVTTNVLLNDSDPNGDSLTLQNVGPASNGTTTLENANGLVSYLPDTGFSGADNFTYTVIDGNGGSTQGLVKVTVNDFQSGSQSPLQSNLDTSGSFYSGDFQDAMGYHFRPDRSGKITHLGGYFEGDKIIKLYERYTWNELASVMVTANNDWQYAPIETPVNVTAGEEYTVAVFLNGSGGWYRFHDADDFYPKTYGDIEILASTKDFDTSTVGFDDNFTQYMYGLADIIFVPGSCNTESYSLPHNQWHQISLPCNPGSNNTVAAVIGDDMPGTIGVDWRIYAYDSESRSYKALTNDDSLNQGTGYWVIQFSGDSINIGIEGSANNEDQTITLITQPESNQWNMIGYPFQDIKPWYSSSILTESGDCIFGCTLNEANTKQIFSNVAWRYNAVSGTYDTLTEESNWTPWYGYWVSTLSEADETNPTLKIPAQ